MSDQSEALPFVPGMRVEHKDASRSERKYFAIGGKTGVVMKYPVPVNHPKIPEVNQGVYVRLNEAVFHPTRGKWLFDWICLPEDLIPLD